ncbi:MAG: quinone-dependent dihydroorotate dehydrogenase [Bacteroidia bacterium]|nr:quinone-dependent dihydroorotate dehydrogenase [Bacteroidia bacterium]
MGCYTKLIRPVFFRVNPEGIHHLVIRLLRLGLAIPGMKYIIRSWCFSSVSGGIELMGLRFPNRVGLAAGFDKDAVCFEELSCLGFGFIEVGTLTPLAQPGNPKPRMFRLPEDHGLINRMGFNNEGVAAAARRLRKRKPGIIIGGNIGKNKNTPNEEAGNDFEKCFRELYGCVDYFAVNVSSPNTPHLRELQEHKPLKRLLQRLQELNTFLQEQYKLEMPRPILLKIAPDLTPQQLDEIADVVKECRLPGVIATNTTVSRENLRTNQALVEKMGDGGLSGKPLGSKSTEVIRYLSRKSEGKFIIIGAGGIHSPEDALEKIEAGASLVQVFTGFIYEGPCLIKKIATTLR